MVFNQSVPSPILMPYIKKYWGIENCIENGMVHTQRIVPSALMELTFYFDHIPKALAESQTISSSTIISGQLNTFYDIEISNKLEMFSVTFHPHGAALLFDMPLSEFTNRNIPLTLVLKADAQHLESTLYEAATFNDKVVAMEHYLMDKLKRKTQSYAVQRISGAIGLMNANREVASVEKLANEVCIGRKQFERTFKDHVGLTPGQFNRVLRFQRSLHIKNCFPHMPLTALAFEVGFFDQSHMVTEFKALSGLTPKQYFSVCEPMSDYFSE